jgi:hypothetical protein
VLDGDIETVYRLSVAHTRECYIGRTSLPLQKRLALHMLDEGGKARWAWMQRAREQGYDFDIVVLERVPAAIGHEAEDRQIRAHRRAGWVVMNERRAQRRDGNRAFLRFAARILHEVYGVPQADLAIRGDIWRKIKPALSYVLYVRGDTRGWKNDLEIRHKRDLRDAIAVLSGLAEYEALWGRGRSLVDADEQRAPQGTDAQQEPQRS